MGKIGAVVDNGAVAFSFTVESAAGESGGVAVVGALPLVARGGEEVGPLVAAPVEAVG